MSAPIDELLISIGIEEGSNLAELHTMLREIQSGGGNIEVDLAGVAGYNQVTRLFGRITQLENNLLAQLVRSPEIAPEIISSVISLAESVSVALETVRVLEHAILDDFYKIEASANILSNSLGWIETAQKGSTEFYNIGQEMIKVVNKVFEFLKSNLGTEGFAERFEEKLEEIKKQCVHKEVQDLIWKVQKIEDYLPSIKGHTTQKLEGAVSELTDRLVHIKNDTELLREKFDVMKSSEFDITPFIDEVNSLSKNLDQLLDGLMMQWVDKIIAKELDLAERIREMGGTYNTLLHHYLRQEIKIDRFTNLLGAKIVKEAEEFAGVMAAIQKTDRSVFNLANPLRTITSQMDKLRENILTIISAQGILDEVLQKIPNIRSVGPTGWEALMSVLNVMAKSENVEEARQRMIDEPTIRAGIRNIESITQKKEFIDTLGLSVSSAANVDKIMTSIDEELFAKFFKPAYDQTEQLWNDMTKYEEENSKKIDSIKDTVERTDDRLEKKSPQDESDIRDAKGRFKTRIREE